VIRITRATPGDLQTLVAFRDQAADSSDVTKPPKKSFSTGGGASEPPTQEPNMRGLS